MTRDTIKITPPKKIPAKRTSKSDVVRAVNQSRKQEMFCTEQLGDYKLLQGKLNAAVQQHKTIIILD